MKKTLLALAFAAAMTPSAAQADPAPTALTNIACALTDIKFGSPFQNATACSGFWDGNVNNVGAGNAWSGDQSGILAGLGIPNAAPNNKVINKFDVADGSAYADFSTAMYGITVVAFHWGGGNPRFDGAVVPTQLDNKGDPKKANDFTAFYKFDAGNLGITRIYFADGMKQSLSNAALYYTGPACEKDCGGGGTGNIVPEPSTYALMAAGLAALGLVARRRRRA